MKGEKDSSPAEAPFIWGKIAAGGMSISMRSIKPGFFPFILTIIGRNEPKKEWVYRSPLFS
jgi:hypothetical protein